VAISLRENVPDFSEFSLVYALEIGWEFRLDPWPPEAREIDFKLLK
jgi:hypothetical protein